MSVQEVDRVKPLSQQCKKKLIAQGANETLSLVLKVACGEKVDRKHYEIDGDLVKVINSKVDKVSGFGGKLRHYSNITIELGNLPVASPLELPARFYKYGRWLEGRVGEIKDEKNSHDAILALQVAAESHYGLTSPSLHPFFNGNGRTARALVNTILMSGADEVRFFREPVPPIPIVRAPKSDSEGYIRALRSVPETGTMLYLMAYFAKKWAENVGAGLREIDAAVKRPYRMGDYKLISTLERRLERLMAIAELHPNYDHDFSVSPYDYPIPDYGY